MGAAVLADIKFGKMKPEDVEDAEHRPDRFPDKSLTSNFGKAFLKNGQIRSNFPGTLVSDSGFGDPCPVGRPYLERKTSLDQEHELAPRLAGMTGDDLLAKRSEFRAQPGDSLQECRGGFLKMAGERQCLGEGVKLSVEHQQGIKTQILKGFLGDLGGHGGVSVTVSPDPVAETQARSRLW